MNRLMMKLMGFVVMNEAAADGAAAGGAVPAAAAPAPTGEPVPAGTPASTLLTPTGEPAASATPPEGDQAAKDLAAQEAAKKAAETRPEGAPEAYADFTLADGFEMDGEILESFKGLAKELNVSQEKAQKFIDLQSQLATKQADAYQAAVVAQGQQWAAEIKNDPQLGGENYDQSVASAVKVIQAFGDESLSHLLNESGLGNHPALFKFCHRISAAISEDKFVMPGSQTTTGRKSNEEVFYGSSN